MNSVVRLATQARLGAFFQLGFPSPARPRIAWARYLGRLHLQSAHRKLPFHDPIQDCAWLQDDHGDARIAGVQREAPHWHPGQLR